MDERFRLHKEDGTYVFPYKKTQRSTGRHGFGCAELGKQDRKGNGFIVDSLEEVILGVVNEGWSVRAKLLKPDTTGPNPGNSVRLHEQVIVGYSLSEDLMHLCAKLSYKPLNYVSSDRDPRSGDPQTEAYKRNPKQHIDTVSWRQVTSRRGQPEFRKKLLDYFSSRCCITDCGIIDLLEAAHIVPHALGGDYSTCNGLLFRSDIHTMFDLNLLTVTEEGICRIDSSLSESGYGNYDGLKIPNPISELRRSNIFKRMSMKS